jgi:teichuronic acid biosynthesis glycosyltransferase TuaG
LKESIESVLNQSFKNFELIIINDCSTNMEVEKIILEYKEKDNRIIYLFNKINLKQAKSRNK